MAWYLLYIRVMKKVIVIDDEPSERLVLKAFLEDRGYEVAAEGTDGDEALELCSEHRPDVVIMDVTMARMDGIDAAVDLNVNCPTATVLLTARDDEETIKRAIEAGVAAYLVKPIKEEDLFATIEVALSRFKEFEAVKNENVDLKKTLEARKIIERAKGLLMSKEGMTEEEAFTRIQKISMDKRKTMREVAEVLLLALDN